MTSKKFEKKVGKASREKLSRMYLNRLGCEPDTETVEELREISEKLPVPLTENLKYAYYENEFSKLNEIKFGLLTGYGQCMGNLVVHHGEIIMCCCREMADLVAFENARYSKGKIFIPGKRGNATNHNGSVFIISDDNGMSFGFCPYCQAVITEKIDMKEYSEDKRAENE